MKYTIEQNGGRWIASDGTNHVEGVDAENAFFDLIHGQSMSEASGLPVEEETRRGRADDQEGRIDRMLIVLIRLLALKAPAPLLRHNVKTICEFVETFITLAELE